MTSEKTLLIYAQIEDVYTTLKSERETLRRKSFSSYLTPPESARYHSLGRLVEKLKKVLEALES